MKMVIQRINCKKRCIHKFIWNLLFSIMIIVFDMRMSSKNNIATLALSYDTTVGQGIIELIPFLDEIEPDQIGQHNLSHPIEVSSTKAQSFDNSHENNSPQNKNQVSSNIDIKKVIDDQPATPNYKNTSNNEISQNVSDIRIQKKPINMKNRTPLHVKNKVLGFKEKEVVKEKSYKRTAIYKFENNITNDSNDSVAMNNSTTNSTQRFTKRLQMYRQKRFQMTRKFFYLQQQKRKLHYELSKPKNLSITCPEIGNHTFTNDPPFDVLGVPKCGDKVKPEIRYDNF